MEQILITALLFLAMIVLTSCVSLQKYNFPFYFCTTWKQMECVGEDNALPTHN